MKEQEKKENEVFDFTQLNVNANPEKTEGKRNYHCLMEFYRLSELLGPVDDDDEDEYINTNNTFFENGTVALDAYINSPCPTVELLTAETKEELLNEMEAMKANYNNPEWINKHLEAE